jgi:hypothetical protein
MARLVKAFPSKLIDEFLDHQFLRLNAKINFLAEYTLTFVVYNAHAALARTNRRMKMDFDLLEHLVTDSNVALDAIGMALSYMSMEERAEVSAWINENHPGDSQWDDLKADMYAVSAEHLPAVQAFEEALLGGQYDWPAMEEFGHNAAEEIANEGPIGPHDGGPDGPGPDGPGQGGEPGSDPVDPPGLPEGGGTEGGGGGEGR